MARSLAQVDTALAAIETQVPKNYAGLQTSLGQLTLVINGQIQALADQVGSPTDATGAPNPTGFYNTLVALQAQIQDLVARVTVLEATP
jgi:hypothetical protein